MKAWCTRNFDTLVVALAAIALAGSVGWSTFQWQTIRAIQPRGAASPGPATNYVPVPVSTVTPVISSWDKPVAQTRGGEWLYELFTPPLIQFDLGRNRYIAGNPDAVQDDQLIPNGRLLAVKYEPYPLQLTGYFERAGVEMALFVTLNGETMLVREGHHFAGLDLMLINFAVRKISTAESELWSATEMVAFATLRDEQTGEEITLDSRTRRLTEALVAVIKPSESGARPREFRIGDSWREVNGTYQIHRISRLPDEVLLEREDASGRRDRIILQADSVSGNATVAGIEARAAHSSMVEKTISHNP